MTLESVGDLHVSWIPSEGYTFWHCRLSVSAQRSRSFSEELGPEKENHRLLPKVSYSRSISSATSCPVFRPTFMIGPTQRKMACEMIPALANGRGWPSNALGGAGAGCQNGIGMTDR